jgi:hypothetical protein
LDFGFWIKGLPTKKIYNRSGKQGAGGRGQGAGGKIKIFFLGNWIIYFLEVPKSLDS